MRKGSKIALVIGLVSLSITAIVVFIVIRIVNDTRNAYASEWVAGEIIDYMETHGGAWPKDWLDLRPIHDRYVSEGKCPWNFAMFQERVLVDWTADPKRLAAIQDQANTPPFSVITLRNGKRANWRNMEPNRMIHDWLREKAKKKLEPTAAASASLGP